MNSGWVGGVPESLHVNFHILAHVIENFLFLAQSRRQLLIGQRSKRICYSLKTEPRILITFCPLMFHILSVYVSDFCNSQEILRGNEENMPIFLFIIIPSLPINATRRVIQILQ